MERSVRVNGEDTPPVRTMKVKDASGSCKVSLRRDLCKEKTSVGSHITITNVVVQLINDEKSVSTTSRTKIEVKSCIYLVVLVIMPFILWQKIYYIHTYVKWIVYFKIKFL